MIVGQFVSFGIGGADKAAFYLTKGLIENNITVKVFYNKLSFPKRSPQVDTDVMLSRYEQYTALGIPMIEIVNLSELNYHSLHILNTHRSGDDVWFMPGFEHTNFNFKIIETNFHGNTATKANLRVFPSYEMIKNKNISGKYVIIPNPIMIPLTDTNLRSALGLENKFVFGKIARPAADIYSQTCLKAYKILDNDKTHLLYMAPHKKALDDVKTIGIKNITFVDQSIDELRISKFYNTINVLCHSNNVGETFGNTIAEAMMHGKPVISHLGNSGCPQAQREVIGEEWSNYVCNNDPIIYSNLMKHLLNTPSTHARFSKYVKNRANSLYDYRVVAKKYTEVYNNI